ncbi:MAG: ribonuclease H-like domain-containing protein [Armatimonadota bacterium]
MPRDDLKARIEALNKKPLKNVPEESVKTTSPGPSFLRRGNTHSTASFDGAQDAGVAERTQNTDCVRLEDVIEGVVTSASDGPGYYLVEMPAMSLEASADVMHKRFVRLTGHPDGEAVTRLARACKSERIAPEEIVFLDLETTGLSTTPVFLIGTMECTPDGLHFKQYFARDYSEEASIVSAFAERMKNMRLVVTFNGKCFDVPFLANRALAKGVYMPAPEFHLDLLHEARRVYRRDLPNCRLQTLEQMVCGRTREDDIPGSQIPQAYHDFVRTGDARDVARILHHNLYDLLTLADLMHRMWYRD